MRAARRIQQRQNFRKGLDNDEVSKKRQEFSSALRKANRMEMAMKRRNFTVEDVDSKPQQSEDVLKRMENLPNYAAAIRNPPNEQVAYEATLEVRKLLSIEKNPPIEEVLKAEVTVPLVKYLTSNCGSELKFEACWALTNIASGTPYQTESVVKANGIAAFVHCLQDESMKVREQAAWALGNIAGDNTTYRDAILKLNVLPVFCKMLETIDKRDFLNNVLWTVSNLCRGRPSPSFDLVRCCIPYIAKLVNNSTHEGTLVEGCWALSYLSDGEENEIQAVMDEGVTRRMVELLMHPSAMVQTPAMRVIGNFVSGNQLQTEMVIKCGALPQLKELIESPRKLVRKEVCWSLSNITAGTRLQIQAVIDHDFIGPLINQINEGEHDVQKEAAYAISNAATSGSKSQVKTLVAQGCLPPLIKLMKSSDIKIVCLALDAISNVLCKGEGINGDASHNPYVYLVQEHGGLDILEELEEHQSKAVWKKAKRIVDDYWDSENDEEVDNIAPVNAGDAFQFGSTTSGESGQFSIY